ncbi:cupin domain-containing protein [Nitrosopumilus sp.]|uniref:cupin domain-containing protein n=1 Tax=Nitrosopumilus sp. TaxID=2024843 RepID=UPI00247EB558|nr:cupin domain-containing protein [Nitrosopumilus sp.]MCV0430291.1 cupin domain-containing protein [Nitrosopumilus sp.]
MLILKDSKIAPIKGNEGANIKQYFHPNNTENGISYSLAQFTLESGKKSKLHKMKSSEVYYILEGKGNLVVEQKNHFLEKNDSAYVPPNSKQFIENIGDEDLKFLCVVEPAWKSSDEILLE